MLRNKLNKTLVIFAALVMVAVVAKAGGPLYIFDAASKKPYWWSTTQPVKVYTDIGPFEILPDPAPPETIEVTNEQADGVVQFAIGQWSNVSTSSFKAQVAGDFASIGLGDVHDGPSAEAVLNTDNGGGIHFVYDADGKVMEQYFGIPIWSGVLGVASSEWANEETGEITEGWVVINATKRYATDNSLEQYAGVFTHEFGHSINLAHSQTNGSIFFTYAGGPAGPKNCATPYQYRNEARDIETMHPFIDPYAYPGFGNPSGKEQSTVDIADDKVALSNLYPSADYSSTTGSVSGKITFGKGNHNGMTGLNIIARNLDDPYEDAISAMSGDYTRPENGKDGTFTIRGLRPGARYVLYFNAIVGGAFPTLQPYHIPSAEEFYNGSKESDNGRTDQPCDYAAITAVGGSTKTANIELNSVKGAPTFLPIGPSLIPTSITSDGKTIAGNAGGLVFKWTEADGASVVGGSQDLYSSVGSMTRDGKTFAGDTMNADGNSQATLFKSKQPPMQLPVPQGGEPCIPSLTNNYGVAANGKAVAGMTWWANCQVRPFIWTPQNGSKLLPVPDGTFDSRPNNISDDGSTVVGWWYGNTFRRMGAIWQNGQFRALSTPEMFVGEAYNTNPDGRTVVGADAGPVNPITGGPDDKQAWYWNQQRGLVRIGRLQPYDTASANAVNDDGTVIAGLGGASGFFGVGQRYAFLWTESLGMVDFEDFLQSQGTYIDGWVMNTALAMSKDGTEIAGYGFGPRASGGWLVKMDQVNMCHAPHGNPSKTSTVNVPFPGGMDVHLAHGDTIGLCSNGR